MQIRVGCTFTYESTYATPMVVIVRPHPFGGHRVVSEQRRVSPTIAVEEYLDAYGNQVWRLVAPSGPFEIAYDAVVEVPATPDLTLPDLSATPIEALPVDVLSFTLPSRYCESDLFLEDAWAMFGDTAPGWARVQAICDWIHSHITYGAGSTSHTSGYQAFLERRGVCRDFAHIGISLCRALNIPARYVFGYLPDIDYYNPLPMDFHAWFEAYLGGAWYTFDARYNTPRIGRVVIGRGRDAVDVALTTSYGASDLINLIVWAEPLKGQGAHN